MRHSIDNGSKTFGRPLKWLCSTVIIWALWSYVLTEKAILTIEALLSRPLFVCFPLWGLLTEAERRKASTGICRGMCRHSSRVYQNSKKTEALDGGSMVNMLLTWKCSRRDASSPNRRSMMWGSWHHWLCEGIGCNWTCPLDFCCS